MPMQKTKDKPAKASLDQLDKMGEPIRMGTTEDMQASGRWYWADANGKDSNLEGEYDKNYPGEPVMAKQKMLHMMKGKTYHR